MNALENWTRVEINGETSYYTQNESGRFECDKNGVLTFFSPEEANSLHQAPYGFGQGNSEKCVRNLIIPEGIREICCDKEKLWELIVVEKLVLPTTLEKLGENVLSGCLIMEMELPVSLREIGAAALMCNYIHVLRIPRGMLHPQYPSGWDWKKVDGTLTVYGRQFKETIVDTLIVPKGYPYERLMQETIINHVVFTEE